MSANPGPLQGGIHLKKDIFQNSAKFPCGPIPLAVFSSRNLCVRKGLVLGENPVPIPCKALRQTKHLDQQNPQITNLNPVMKPLSYAFLAAMAVCGFASAAETAYTTPVGYYDFDAKAGGNLLVPGLVKSAVYAGAITADGATTLTVPAAALTANAFNEGATYATHYVEITQAGANQGVVIDIVSNTDSVITLASDISALSLAGTETIEVHPHMTIASALANAEANLAAFSDAATFYNPDGSSNTYYFIGSSTWSSDFSTPDGSDRPIPPGTGVVFDTSADVLLTVAGEVKSDDVVVQVAGSGVINIVGPVNPLVGNSDLIKNLGFADMSPFSDNITIYPPGDLITSSGTYYADGAGDVTIDFVNPSLDTFSFTKGAIFAAAVDTAFRIKSGQ